LRIVRFECRYFRNLLSCVLAPSPRVNLILGANAQGKTNLLEAIHVACGNKSFRGAHDKDLVTFGRSEGYYLKAICSGNDRSLVFEQFLADSGNRVRRINNKPASLRDEVGMHTVVFTPEDLYLIKGEPERRRNFLDGVLCRLNRDYRYGLERYKTVLKRRNAALKSGFASLRSLEVLNSVFIETAVPLIFTRLGLTAILEREVTGLYQLLTGENTEIRLKYALSFPLRGGNVTLESLRVSMTEALQACKEKEAKQGTTVLGPHRDDFNLYLGGRNARVYGSQGQQRSLAVSLKLAEIAVFKNVKGYYPALLLDEVLAELDRNRKLLLLEYLRQGNFQTFISSVEPEDVAAVAGKIFSVEGGRVTEEA